MTGQDAATGRLVLVATPIGNLDDLSPRAAAVLASADVIAAEDTRHSRVLLERVGARAQLRSYHDHNEDARAPQLLDRVAAGDTVAVITDAGMPGVADPGLALVRAAIARGVTVEVVPGPTAVVTALVLSGLPTDRFVFEGFLPRKAGPRDRRLAELAADSRTVVCYLAPHRAADELAALAAAFGDRPAALARELTKRHEEVWRATLPELAERAAAERVRGEVTLVIAGAPQEPTEAVGPETLAERVRELIATGDTKKDAIARVAQATGLPKRDVYQAVVDAS